MGTATQSAPPVTTPMFQSEAEQAVRDLMQTSAEQLETLLHVNRSIALENVERFGEFFAAKPKAALAAYTGVVFKHIHPAAFSAEDWAYAQRHLLITSFLYGLLRPTDGIRPYRLEGSARLQCDGGKTRFEYWRPLLTDVLIKAVKADDGVLINLASAEMKQLFDWRRVTKEVRVVTPSFLVNKNGKLRIIVVYAKMCRGEMTRFLLSSRLGQPEQMAGFEWEGFRFAGDENDAPVFVLEE